MKFFSLNAELTTVRSTYICIESVADNVVELSTVPTMKYRRTKCWNCVAYRQWSTSGQSGGIAYRTDNGVQADKVLELRSVPTMEYKRTKRWN